MEKNNLTIPAAIVVAGLLIAGAVFFTRAGNLKTDPNGVGQPNTQDIAIRPADKDDHIRGNPNAEVQIIEYSDTECPFCKQFHQTMHQVMDAYAKDGKVAWIYRHFPLYKGTAPLHPLAFKEAEATECVAELGGEEKFWQYLDSIYAVTPSNNKLDPAKLPELAENIGINRSQFQTCLDSDKYKDKISKSYDEALAAGANGTPYSVVLTNDGKKVPISGAESFVAVKGIIDTLLKAQ